MSKVPLLRTGVGASSHDTKQQHIPDHDAKETSRLANSLLPRLSKLQKQLAPMWGKRKLVETIDRFVDEAEILSKWSDQRQQVIQKLIVNPISYPRVIAETIADYLAPSTDVGGAALALSQMSSKKKLKAEQQASTIVFDYLNDAEVLACFADYTEAELQFDPTQGQPAELVDVGGAYAAEIRADLRFTLGYFQQFFTKSAPHEGTEHVQHVEIAIRELDDVIPELEQDIAGRMELEQRLRQRVRLDGCVALGHIGMFIVSGTISGTIVSAAGGSISLAGTIGSATFTGIAELFDAYEVYRGREVLTKWKFLEKVLLDTAMISSAYGLSQSFQEWPEELGYGALAGTAGGAMNLVVGMSYLAAIAAKDVALNFARRRGWW